MTTDIKYEDFAKLDLRIATVVGVEEVEGADKLLKLTLDAGDLGERVIATGIKEWYSEDDLVGRQIVYLANLEPKELRGVVSQGMLLAASDDKPILLTTESKTSPGAKIK